MLLQQVLNGLLLGSTYSLVALGFTLILGVLGLLNFALGETVMLGAYAGMVILSSFLLPLPFALAGAMAMGAAVAAVTYLVSFRMVRKEYFAAPILSTIGLGIVLADVASKAWGSGPRNFPEALPVENFDLGAVSISPAQIVIAGTAVALMAALYFLVTRTRTGQAMRAIAENPRAAALLGVHVEQVILATFIISGALAGAAGVLTGLAFYTISPYMGFNSTLKGMTVMVLGGLGNVQGAMVGGILIGLVEILSVAYVSATFRDALVFVILIAVLVLRPQGLFGMRTQEERV